MIGAPSDAGEDCGCADALRRRPTTTSSSAAAAAGLRGRVPPRRRPPDATVLLIEAGPDGRGVAQIVDPPQWTKLDGTALDWGYRYAPSAAWRAGPIAIPRGKVLGGCSATNAMQWFRGHADDYDAWERAGAAGWNYAALLPYFRRSEDWEGGASAHRGAGGPMRVTRPKDPHPIAAAMIEGAAELGLAKLDDAQRGRQRGRRPRQPEHRRGPPVQRRRRVPARLGAAARPRPGPGRGLGPRPGAAAQPHRAHRLDRGTARLRREPSAPGRGPVRLGFPHRPRHAPPDACPRSRWCSRSARSARPRCSFAPASATRANCAPSASRSPAPLPGVGRNLQDHPLMMGMNFRARRRLGLPRDNGGGAMMNWRSSRAARPDLHAFVVQGRHAYPDGRRPLRPGRRRRRLRDLPGADGLVGKGRLTVRDVISVRPGRGRDRVRLPHRAAPTWTPWSRPWTRSWTWPPPPPTGAWWPGRLMPATRLSRAEKEAFVRENCSTLCHPCGTAAMGTGPDAVVGPDLRVAGVDGLCIADASVIPVIPACNTQAAGHRDRRARGRPHHCPRRRRDDGRSS